MSTHFVRAAWLLNAAIVLLLLAQPVSTTVQLEMSVGAICLMVLLWGFGRGRAAHYVFLAIGSLVVLKYLYWRTTSTLPPTSDLPDFTAGIILLVAELYCFYILFVSLVINADPLNRELAEVADEDDLPTVDVFVPTYNEDQFILATTLAAARSLDYPAEKLTVWLLDDGGTDQKCSDPDRKKSNEARARKIALQRLSEELGVKYLTRKLNTHAKAGNLNNGLQNSAAEIVVVFDADHVPFRSFLKDTIGHFAKDPKLFLVQTPHAFINPDPVERNLQTFDKMPSENEMFYAITQRGLDKWNGSFFCGSAALLRRTALEEAGGFSGITITEDCETAFELHSRGWTSVYVDKTLIAGLQPESLSAFIGQRSRWCQGMMQIMILKNPLFKRGLKPLQRLSYLSSMTFWFFPIPRLIFMFAPLLYIFFDMKIFVANVQEAVAYTATYIIVNLMLQNYLYGRVRWPFISELYEYVQGLFLIKAMASVILSPRKPKFNVTAKNVALDHDELSPLAFPYFLVYAILLVGTVVSTYRYFFEPGITNLMLVVGLWNLFNLITAGAALGVVAERKQAEKAPSIAINRHAMLRMNGLAMDVRVERISALKCKIRMDAAIPNQRVDDTNEGVLSILPMTERLAEADAVYPSIPVKLTGTTIADGEAVCELTFDRLSPRDYFALSDVMYGDADVMARFQKGRRSHKNLLSGTFQFIWWGLVEPFRAVSYLFIAADPERSDSQDVEPAPKQLGVGRKLAAPSMHATDPFALSLKGPAAEAASAGEVAHNRRSTETRTSPSWVELVVQEENEALAKQSAAKASESVKAEEATNV